MQNELLSPEEVDHALDQASQDRLARGPVVFQFEDCPQQISHHPCETVRPCGAIEVGELIAVIAELIAHAYNDCTTCISKSPGVDFFVLDMARGRETAPVRLASKFPSLPQPEGVIRGLDRARKRVSSGRLRLARLTSAQPFDRTLGVTLPNTKQFDLEFRGILLRGHS